MAEVLCFELNLERLLIVPTRVTVRFFRLELDW